MSRNRKTEKNNPRVLISSSRIRSRIRLLGRQISRDYRGKDLVLLGILKGAFIFMADLARQITVPLTCDFMRVSSYGDATKSSGHIRVEFDITQPIAGKHVLVIEDIVDTGLTAKAVLETLRAKRPASVRMCTLLKKENPRAIKVPVDYVGFTVPDTFVVGYGLDHAGQHRHLPCIAALRDSGPGQ